MTMWGKYLSKGDKIQKMTREYKIKRISILMHKLKGKGKFTVVMSGRLHCMR